MALLRILTTDEGTNAKVDAALAKIGVTAQRVGDTGSASFKTLGLAAAGFTAALGLVHAAQRAIGAGFDEIARSLAKFGAQEQAVAQVAASIKSTGGAAGVTTSEMVELAAGLQKVTSFGDESILSMEAMLLTFTKLGRDVLPQATEVVLDMSTKLGQDLKTSAIQVGKALQDPILGVTALRRVGVNFTSAQQDVIRSLVETGKEAEAQAIILRELQTEFGGSARAARDTYAGALEALGHAAGDLEEKLGAGLAPAIADVADLLSGIASHQDAATAMTLIGRALGEMVDQATALVKLSAPLLRILDRFATAGEGFKTLDTFTKQLELEAALQKGIADTFEKTAAQRAEQQRIIAEVESQIAAQQKRNAEAAVKNAEDEIEATKRKIAAHKSNISAIREEYAALRDAQEHVANELETGPSAVPDTIGRSVEDSVAAAIDAGIERGFGDQPARREIDLFGEYIGQSVEYALADALHAAFSGASLGEVVAGFTEALGGAIGYAYGGPVGGAIGSGVGAALGSLFTQTAERWQVAAYAAFSDTGDAITEGLSGLSGQLAAALQDMLDSIGGVVSGLPEITLQVNAAGDQFRALLEGELVGVFSSSGEAIAAALKEAFSRADLSGVADEIRHVLETSTAQTVEALQAQLDVAQQIADLRAGIGETGQALRQLQLEFEKTASIARSAGLDTSALNQQFIENLKRYADQILGIQRSESEARQAQIDDYNAYVASLRAQLEAELALRQQQAEAAAAAGQRAGLAGEEIHRATGGIANDLTALLARIAELTNLIASLPAPLDPSQAQGGGRGPGRRQLRERLSQQAATFGMSDVQRQIFEAERSFADFAAELDKARFPAEEHARLLEKAAEEREREIAAIRAAIGLRVDEFTRTGPAAQAESELAAIHQTAAQLIEDIHGLGLSMDEETRQIERVTQAEQERIQALADNAALGAQGLFADILEFAGMEEDAARLRWQLQVDSYQLELDLYRAQFELFGLATDTLDEMQKILDRAVAAGYQGGAGTERITFDNPAYAQAVQRRQASERTWEDFEKRIEAARKTLQGFLDLGLNPFQRDLKGITDTFAELISVLGRTAEVTHALELALEDLQDRYLAGIRAFLTSLQTGPQNPGGVLSQRAAAKAEYERLLALVQGGDYSQADALAAAAQNYLQLQGQSFGTTGAGYGALYAQIQAALENVLANAPGVIADLTNRDIVDAIREVAPAVPFPTYYPLPPEQLTLIRQPLNPAPPTTPQIPPTPAPQPEFLTALGFLSDIANNTGGTVLAINRLDLRSAVPSFP